MATLAVDGDRVYVGGSFKSIDDVARPGLAALSTVDLAVTSWAPPSGGIVLTLATAGERVYAGGTLEDASGPRSVAAYSRDTGALLPSRPADLPPSNVRAIAEGGGTVFVGGQWPKPGGGAAEVVPLTGFDRTSGARLWLPQLGLNPDGNLRPGLPAMNDLQMIGGDLVVAGRFRTNEGAARGNVARFDSTTRAIRPWTSDANGDVHALARAPAESSPREASFTGIGLRPRNGLAAFAAYDGALLPWDANLGAATTIGVTDLDTAGGLLYVSGLFHAVGPDTRHSSRRSIP